MTSHVVHSLVEYQYLRERLQAEFPEADEDTLRDTLEGLSSLPEALASVLRSYLDDLTLAAALGMRIDDMQERLSRIEHRADKKRELVSSVMERADIKKLAEPDFTAFPPALTACRGGDRRRANTPSLLEATAAQTRSARNLHGAQVRRHGSWRAPQQFRDGAFCEDQVMAFSEAQNRLLSGKLNRRHVRTRESRGQVLSYIEGWHVIAEANRVFGFEGWDRETVWCECVWEDGRRDPKASAYAARVRIRVRAGDGIVCREGSGVGNGTGATLGEAHENALKEAETDAMKRALTTFGNLFGLALYDKEQAGVRGAARTMTGREAPALAWTVLSPAGDVIATCSEPKAFCTRLRQALTSALDIAYLRALWNQNAALVQSLEAHRPDLVTRMGVHFASVLASVFEAQCAKLIAQNSTEPTNTGPVDKSVLAIAAPKRIRDGEHLEYVAALPCLVCGRLPSQAHHLRFAQPRALGSKVSDEWVLPLCNLHHRALHDCGAEETWWKAHNIDAISEAKRLWGARQASANPPSESEVVASSQT